MSELVIPDYAVHDDENIKGFFGPYRWLSNFYTCDIEYRGRMFSCVENAYQAAKCLRLSDFDEFVGITPTEAKKLIKTLPINPIDYRNRNLIMLGLLTQKFAHDSLRERLINTRGRYLEETNNWRDSQWGVYNGLGQNKLGKMLMFVRDML